MNINIIEHDGTQIAELDSEDIVISSFQDGLDLMGNAYYQGIHSIIAYENQFSSDFFDLKTRVAGDILQKYATYNIKLAIIGEFEKFESNALNAFILECNRGNSIFFVKDRDDALGMLIKAK